MNKLKLKKPIRIEWDEGNKEKNVEKHNVQNSETEEIFFNNPIIIEDINYSQEEERYFALGTTDSGRHIIISFTIRGEKHEHIRAIMSRDQYKKESAYELKLRKEVKQKK